MLDKKQKVRFIFYYQIFQYILLFSANEFPNYSTLNWVSIDSLANNTKNENNKKEDDINDTVVNYNQLSWVHNEIARTEQSERVEADLLQEMSELERKQTEKEANQTMEKISEELEQLGVEKIIGKIL